MTKCQSDRDRRTDGQNCRSEYCMIWHIVSSVRGITGKVT